MAVRRMTFTLDDDLAEVARELGISVSAAALDGLASAVRAALAERDRHAYRTQPEVADPFWDGAQAWK